MKKPLWLFLTIGIAGAFLEGLRAAETPPPPDDFPRFEFPGHDEAAGLLSGYLWYHFHHRLGNSPTLFNKEYLLLADTWMDGAVDRRRRKPIQEVHREDLLKIELDDEGYVGTHQHFSHAHDLGWPFPLWTQAGTVRGITVGWHFQPLDRVPGWAGDHLRHWRLTEFCGEDAIAAWGLENARSLGLIENRWQVEGAGPSPALLTPAGVEIDAFNAPFLQLRWKRSGTPHRHALPYVEWLRVGEEEFGPDRRVHFGFDRTPLSPANLYHSHLTMHRHPLWRGQIQRLRLVLAPDEPEVTFEIDSFFTVYDTRHTINNPIFILASAAYFGWTGDLDYLRRRINDLRIALRHQQTVLGGLEFLRIRNPWPGHDGLAGYVRRSDGSLDLRLGHGIGNNYWDLMPFGWDDFYATSQYHAATLKLAELEEAIRANPGWAVPQGALAFDPAELRRHAAAVQQAATGFFWNADTGRFLAAIDRDGNRHDYGYTFLNLDAIWYGIAGPDHARSILDWIDGRRVVEGDTSTGADIYRWRFGPRATTRRNIDWYGHVWTGPETIPWGGQVQDGGAVLGFTFYDLWARLREFGPDNAWQRLAEILEWEKEVQAAGGYRAYYAGGHQGTTLQGGGTAGGLGIDFEFFESSLLPSIVVYGFLGLEPRPTGLAIRPGLPAACPEMGLTGLRYGNTGLDLRVGPSSIVLVVKEAPPAALAVELEAGWKLEGAPDAASPFRVTRAGTHRWTR